MNLPLVSSILALCLISVLGYDEQKFINGFFAGRSGDIIVDSTDVSPIEIQLPWKLTRNQAPISTVRDVHVNNLIARSLGLPQVRLPGALGLDTEMDDTIPFNYFSQPKGNLFFSIEGFYSESFPSLKAFPKYELSQMSQPYHPLSTLATLTTGVLPRKHGIVKYDFTTRTIENIFDLSTILYDESERPVSGAMDQHYAEVLSSGNSFHWHSSTSAFNVAADGGIQVGKGSYAEILSKITYLTFDGSSAKLGNYLFDLNDEVDNALFAEAAFVSAWAYHVGKGSSMSTQNFLSFHFTSLKGIKEKYGESEALIAALRLIDEVIANSIASDNFTFEIVYLPSLKTLDVTKPISQYVAKAAYPHIYLTEEGKGKILELCEDLRALLSTTGDVYCPHRLLHEKRLADDAAVAPVPIMSSERTIMAFHFTLWIMLVLIGVLIWAVIAIATIEPDESIETAVNFKRGRA